MGALTWPQRNDSTTGHTRGVKVTSARAHSKSARRGVGEPVAKLSRGALLCGSQGQPLDTLWRLRSQRAGSPGEFTAEEVTARRPRARAPHTPRLRARRLPGVSKPTMSKAGAGSYERLAWARGACEGQSPDPGPGGRLCSRPRVDVPLTGSRWRRGGGKGGAETAGSAVSVLAAPAHGAGGCGSQAGPRGPARGRPGVL